MLVGLLLLQVAAGPPLPLELRKRPPRATMPCPVQTDPDGEIVVCARPTDQRVAKLAEPVQPVRGDPLSFRLPGGGTGNVHAIRTELPGASGQGGRGDAEDAVRQGKAGVGAPAAAPTLLLSREGGSPVWVPAFAGKHAVVG